MPGCADRPSGSRTCNSPVAIRAKSLASLARIATTDGPVLVRRENGSRFALIQSSVSGRDLVGFVDEARAAVARDVPLPPGYRVEWGASSRTSSAAAAWHGGAGGPGVDLLRVVHDLRLGAAGRSSSATCRLPWSAAWRRWWLSGQYLSVPASVGFIALLGIAVLNGLVLVTHFNHLHALGLPMEQVVREGSLRRLRPVLMTASITAFGLVLLLASGPGSEIQRPLAIVVIGGLVSSTALTLVLLPVLYRRFGQAISSKQSPRMNGLKEAQLVRLNLVFPPTLEDAVTDALMADRCCQGSPCCTQKGIPATSRARPFARRFAAVWIGVSSGC